MFFYYKLTESANVNAQTITPENDLILLIKCINTIFVKHLKKPISDTAILIFTRSLESESLHKKISDTQNIKILQKLIDHTKQVVKQSCLPYFISSDEYQFGDTFGERLFNEMSRVFNSGYEKIIVIGNDSPELTSETLLDASIKIQKDKIILGPSEDGGVYLIAIHRENLNRDLFLNIPWLSDKVLKGFNKYTEKLLLKIESLSKLGDIDSEKDLREYIDKYPLNRLVLSIISLLASNTQKGSQNKESIFSFDIIGFKQMRAPPSWAN